MDDREKARDDEPQPEQEEKRLEDLEPSDEESADVKAGARLAPSRKSGLRP